MKSTYQVKICPEVGLFNDTLEQVYARWKDVHFRDLTDKEKEGYLIAWENTFASLMVAAGGCNLNTCKKI